jgi:TPR repeat protein
MRFLLVAMAVTPLLLGGALAGADDSKKTFPVRETYVSFIELLSLAKDGDDEAQVTLGTAYAAGSVGPVDMENAVQWWTEAAKKGNTKAQTALGTRYGLGMGVERNIDKALYWLKEADQKGDSSAAAELGYMYEHGETVPQSYGDAAGWYTRAANLGDGASQWALGEFYEKGLGVSRDLAEAKKWYAAAAAQGFGGAKRDLERLSTAGERPETDKKSKNPNAIAPQKELEALNGLAKLLSEFGLMEDLKSGKCSEAPNVKEKAFRGDAKSIYLLSDMYRNGWCVDENIDRFHMYLEDAAAKGERSAAFDIGFYYEYGSGGYPVSYNVARDWYQRAIKAGEERAMVQLGDMLLTGKGKKDLGEGIKLLERAGASNASEVSNRALDILSMAYLPGGALPVSVKKARAYALRSAAQCDPVGMLAVSVSYDQPPTLVQSWAWANI